MLDVHASAAVHDGPLAGGGGAALGLNLGHLDVEIAGDVAGGLESAAWLRPQLRLIPERERDIGTHLILGGGALFAPEGLRHAAGIGAGFDVLRGPWRPRLQASWVGWPGDEPWRAWLSVGLVHRPAERPEPQPQPVVAAEPPRFDASLVWVPGPVCEWLPPDDASARFAETSADPWSTPRVGSRRPGADVTDSAQRRGDLVVVGFPGDVVSAAGVELTLAADGVGWTTLDEGPVDVVVRGGGRTQAEQVAVGAGATVWLTAPPPTTARISFAVGNDRLDADATAALAALARDAGRWTFSVWGSYSPEGDVAANQALATRRAEAARAALVSGGVAAERVRVEAPREPEPNLPPELQRAAVVQPVEAP